MTNAIKTLCTYGFRGPHYANACIELLYRVEQVSRYVTRPRTLLAAVAS